METLYQYAYCSSLRPQVSPTSVAEIVHVSRRNNQRADVTGILVFDGWRFFQYSEGEQAAITALIDRIRDDPRHEAFQELLSGPLDGPRRFQRWSVAYPETDAEDLVSHLSRLTGSTLIEHLQQLLIHSDMEP